MTVKQAIEILKTMPPDAKMVVNDGYEFSPLNRFTVGRYSPRCRWEGEFEEVDVAADVNAVCVWPEN